MDPITSTSNPEQQIKEADDRAEQAKASLMSRIEELGRRFKGAKQSLDLKAQIGAHPWPAVGIALAAGVLTGVLGGPSASDSDGPRGKSTVSSAVLAALGALAVRALKDVALRQVATLAKNWLHGDEKTDQGSSRDPSVEALQH